VASVTEHYDRHLGPVYSWMIGDVSAAIDRNREELAALGIRRGLTGTAVDLGAGPGLHAIPLAELGFSVLALDSCSPLVEELRQRAGDLQVRAVPTDLLRFRDEIDGQADVIVCMGDTLTHLPTREAVQSLLEEVADALTTPGIFITTFRDYLSTELIGASRFIPVRNDEARSLTCFLEYADEFVTVYDLLFERVSTEWQLRVSSYPKLRLDPAWVADTLTSLGFAVQQDMISNGMVRIVARYA
jgi:SAM-dependent methyltransferase